MELRVTPRSQMGTAAALSALLTVTLLTSATDGYSPFSVRPPESPFWSLSLSGGGAAFSTLGRASRAVIHDQALAFDPNLPPELHIAVPREIVDSTPAFARGATGFDVVTEFHRLEQQFGAPPPALPPPAVPRQHSHVSAEHVTLHVTPHVTSHVTPTSYTYRRDGGFVAKGAGIGSADHEAWLRSRGAGRRRTRVRARGTVRGEGRTYSRGRTQGAGRALGKPRLLDVPARELPLEEEPLLQEVDIVMPRPPDYRTSFQPPSWNGTALQGRRLGQPRIDCALELSGRGCITYEAIDAAFQESLNYVELDLPRGEWLPTNVATVGQALLKTSINIANRYDLSPYEIEHLLPRADTLHTSIGEVCPDFASPIQCHPKRYRRIDGLCNNVKFPNWGATRRVFQRLLEPHYPDGIARPNLKDLPSPRVVSSTVHRDRDLFDHASTLMMIAWGQFMDHDFTLTFTRPDERTLNEPEDCCHNSGPKDCLPIRVPRDDRFYAKYGVDCIDFVRGQPGVRQFCRLGSRVGFNVLTSVIDAGTVYGGTEESASDLRMLEGGKLKSYMPEHFKQYGMLPLLPQRFENHDEGCIRDHPGQKCFLAGEIRVNEQLILSTMHLAWFREHNRICAIFKKLNPHWDDEKLYQETRRIVIACIQHITFNEFLPMLLGKKTMKEHDIIVKDHGYWDGYNEYEDPSITLAFMTSAYRFGHSLLPSVVEKWSPTHKYIAERDLSDLIRRPFDLYEPGAVDEYILGQLNQPAMAMDFAITDEVTTMLFRQPTKDHGIDLVALNLQRAREMGVPGYMHYRRWCGLPTTSSWHQFRSYVSNHTADQYKRMYKSPWDIDLFSGGISERPLPSSMVGPTFACIIAAQMHKVRHGDRFWYELGGQPSSFTPDQLTQIRRVQLSRVLCDNTDRIETIQVYPLVLPDYEVNPRVACNSGVLPHVDLNYWREDRY